MYHGMALHTLAFTLPSPFACHLPSVAISWLPPAHAAHTYTALVADTYTPHTLRRLARVPRTFCRKSRIGVDGEQDASIYTYRHLTFHGLRIDLPGI